MLFNTKDKGTFLGNISQKIQHNKESQEYSSILKSFRGNTDDLLKTDFSSYTSLSDNVKENLVQIQTEMKRTQKTGDDMFDAIQNQMTVTASKSSQLVTTIGNIGKTLLTGLLSGAVAAGMSWLIGKAIELADSWIITRKEAEKMAASFSSNFSEMQKSQGDTVKTIRGLDAEFEKLSTGVNALGQNVSLTDEEFDRYHEITNLIAEKIPSLVSGYDEQGNAIIRLTDNVKNLSDAYRDEMQAEASAQYAMKDDSGKTLVEGVFKNAQNKTKDYDRKRAAYQKLVSANYKELEDLYNNNYVDNDYISEILDELGFAQTKEIDEARIHSELVLSQRKFESDIQVVSKQVSNAGLEFAQSLIDYWGDEFTDNQRNMFNSFISQMDMDFLLNTHEWGKLTDLDLLNQKDMEKFISELLTQFQTLDPNDINQINARFNLITTFNNGEITLGEYEEKLQELNAWMNSIPDDGLKKVIEILFNINSTEESDIERYRQHLKDIMGGKYSDEFADSLSFEELEATMTIKPKVEYDEFGNELKYVEEKIMYDRQGVPYKLYIKPEYDSDEIKEQISNDLSPVEVEIEPKTKYSDQTASLDELEKSFSGLATTYDTTVNLSEKVDASDLEKVNADMGGVTFNVKDEDVDKINSMSNAIEAYDQTLIKSAGDAEAAQAAADKLATAYVDHSDVLDNLIDHLDEVTEEEKAYVKEQLEVNGIQNAEEVITTRLTKRYKAYSAALVDVSKQMAQYRNDVENVIETGEDSNGVASKMKESVTKMLSTYNDEGVAITTPQIDEQFIVDNLAQIKAATEGDLAAFDELMFKVAQLNAMQVLIDANIDEETAAAQAANIMDMVMQANEQDIEIGAYIDDAPFLAALSEMMSSSQTMADSVGKAFESMGYEATWVPNRYKTTVATAMVNSGVKSLNGDTNYTAQAQTRIGLSNLQREEIEVDVPSLQIRRKGSASGVSAVYGGAPKSSSGGGGGGGGGGGSSSEPTKPKEEGEESFDWIEVAIQRIEEEIARLDKVVGNSYDFWIKRNEALLKEIDKTKDEIKAQQIAYSEYLRNANAVQVNNGKGLNADDYGENDSLVKAQDERLLAEAKKAWATGEYQKKVQEGLMTGKDIETIQNHFLAETIKTYQELYNKAISAQDAVQDLKIKLGDLARTNFDHVKGEAEDAIAYFESYADLINARIERTEEKGYFATKTFQGALISYEQERLKVLKKEYDDLIAKRDEATRTKAILPYSEEFNKMNQEILEVGKSIEEATTNLVKFNNEMRQHDWDVFDFTQERINNIAEEFDFLIDLLDNQKLYDDYGLFNSRGWADSALHAGKYNAYMEQALQYAKEREKIEADLEKDNADKNLIERREELIKLQQESITNAYAEKEAVKSLVEEGINIHLDALSKLIDEYKTSLKEAKSLYDYQKNIANQTKNITNLQKQLAAYTGDDSEETRALRQRLNKQLEDAQTQLRETQWDKYISETEEFLGDMYEEYEELLNKQLEDIDKLMHDMIGEINTHGSDIRTAINDVTKDVAYKMTDNANTFLETGTLVSDFKVNFDNYSTTILKAVGDIVTAVQSIANETVTAQVNGKAVGKSNIKVNTVRNGVDYADVFDINYYMAHNPDLQKAFGDDYDKYLDHFIKNGMKEARQAIETFNVDIYKANYKDLRDAFGSDLVAYYLHYIRNGKREKRKAYAGGSQHINSNQLAWTQDGGGELIYRSSDGAILTPLNIGDKVFTNEMSENLWKLAQLKPTIPTGNARTITNNNAIAITLPNVTNYEQFKTALQNDPKMVGFIQQVTLGEANGSAKLNKRKY